MLLTTWYAAGVAGSLPPGLTRLVADPRRRLILTDYANYDPEFEADDWLLTRGPLVRAGWGAGAGAITHRRPSSS